MIGLQMMHEMGDLQREMDQLFRGLGFNSVVGGTSQNSQVKVCDKGESFEVDAVLPGLDIEKLDISILGRRLTLTGEFASTDTLEATTWHRRERQVGHFEKNLQLTANVEVEKVEAEYQQGILRITLPKAASALPRKINVKAA